MRRRAFLTGMEDGMSKVRQNRQVWPLKNLSAQIQEPRLLVRLAEAPSASWAMAALEGGASWAQASGKRQSTIGNAMATAKQNRRFNVRCTSPVINKIE